MFEALEKINERPILFQFYTAMGAAIQHAVDDPGFQSKALTQTNRMNRLFNINSDCAIIGQMEGCHRHVGAA